jgi:hypothetical protein
MLVNPEALAHTRRTKVRIHEENSRVRGLSERARKIDGGSGLAVGGDRAGDRDDGEIGRFPELFYRMTQLPVLLCFERCRCEQTHQVFVELEITISESQTAVRLDGELLRRPKR